jgi:hypothetical protein
MNHFFAISLVRACCRLIGLQPQQTPLRVQSSVSGNVISKDLTPWFLFLVLISLLYSSRSVAAPQYYWWNQSGFNCLGPWSPGGPSFHTESLQGTIDLTLQKSVETNATNPGWCITLQYLQPTGSPYYDEGNAQYPWAVPVSGQTGQGGGYRFFNDLIRITGIGVEPKNAGPVCGSIGNPINPSVGNKFDVVEDFANNAKTSCDVSIGCSPGRIWETGVVDASVLSEGQPDEQS